MSDVIPLAGAVDGLRMLKDGGVSVTLIFEPKDRVAVMTMMGQPGASIACVRLKDGHAAIPAPTAQRDTRGPLCKEACDLCLNLKFQKWACTGPGVGMAFECSEKGAKDFILRACGISSRRELDEDESAANEFAHKVRKPFLAWVREQAK